MSSHARSASTDHRQLRGHPVEHLAAGAACVVQVDAAVGAGVARRRNDGLQTRQVGRQRRAMGWLVGDGRAPGSTVGSTRRADGTPGCQRVELGRLHMSRKGPHWSCAPLCRFRPAVADLTTRSGSVARRCGFEFKGVEHSAAGFSGGPRRHFGHQTSMGLGAAAPAVQGQSPCLTFGKSARVRPRSR